MDGDNDIVTMASQGLVDGIIDNLEHQVVQTGAIGRITDVHTRTLTHGLQTFKNLNTGFTVTR